MKLKELAKIYTGYSFRDRLKNDPEGDTKIIQMGDVDKHEGIMLDKLISISDFNPRKEHYYLYLGDIIFVNKGYNLHAYLIPDNKAKMTAINSFSIIKINSREVSPAYLTWFLNSRPAQHYFRVMSAGTNIPNVSMDALGNIDVVLPSREKQELIARIDELKSREARISKRLSLKRQEYIDHILKKSLDRKRDRKS